MFDEVCREYFEIAATNSTSDNTMEALAFLKEHMEYNDISAEQMELFENATADLREKAALILTDVITMGFCAFMVPSMLNVIGNLAARGSKTMLLKLPQGAVYAIIPFALVMTVIRFVQEIVKIVKAPDHENVTVSGKSVFDGIETPDAEKEGSAV